MSQPRTTHPLTLREADRVLTAPGATFEMETALIRGQHLRLWKHAPPTLRDVFASTTRFAQREFVVYQNERMTFAEHFEHANRLGHALLEEFGVRPGDRVALAMRNYPEAVVSFWAAAIVGAVVVPINAWWKGDELEYALKDCAARVLIADQERLARLEGRMPEIIRIAVRTHSAPDTVTLTDLLARYDGTQIPHLPNGYELAPDDPATLFYTSGTTGNPKGALGTHRNICTNILSTSYGRMRALLRRGEELPEPGATPAQKSTLLSVPLFHATGCHAIMVTCAFGGNKLVLMRRWDAGSALALIEAERINSFGGVPAVPWQILEHPALNATDTSSVEAIGYGGVPAAPELVKRIAQAFPAVSPGNGWGLTETSAVTTQNSGIDYAQRPDSVGVPVPVCDVVVGDPHAPLPPENAGELWVRGPNVVREYWGNPQATAHAFVDGWFRTGDIGRIDADGFVYILDRAKDMLIRGGENICCVEVENALYEHPEVMDAAVVGVPHRVLGEEVGAVVQRVPGGTLSAEKLKAFVSERLAHFKVPVAVEFTMDPLPRNANGKILKQTLRDVFRGHNVG